MVRELPPGLRPNMHVVPLTDKDRAVMGAINLGLVKVSIGDYRPGVHNGTPLERFFRTYHIGDRDVSFQCGFLIENKLAYVSAVTTLGKSSKKPLLLSIKLTGAGRNML